MAAVPHIRREASEWAPETFGGPDKGTNMDNVDEETLLKQAKHFVAVERQRCGSGGGGGVTRTPSPVLLLSAAGRAV